MAPISLKTESDNFPVEVYFLRDDDIPQYVEDAVADIGMVGENVVYEKNKKIEVVERLGFGQCRLSVAVAETINEKAFLPLPTAGLRPHTRFW